MCCSLLRIQFTSSTQIKPSQRLCWIVHRDCCIFWTSARHRLALFNSNTFLVAYERLHVYGSAFL